MTRISMDTLRRLYDSLPAKEYAAVEQVLAHRAFDFVCSQGNTDPSTGKVDWKGPIDCIVYLKTAMFTVDFYVHAIKYMTATEPTVHGNPGLEEQGAVRITAPGYRMGPAGP